jgi:signal transduction histidine kinase
MDQQCRQRLQDCEHQLEILRELSEAIISQASLNQVLELVANRARELIAADTLLIPMLDEQGQEYCYAAASGKDAEDISGTRFPVRTGMCGWVLVNQKPLLYGEFDDWPLANQQNRWEQGSTSALLVPLIVQKRIIGGLSATGKIGGGSFTKRDMELLTLFANQVSIAIENARLLNEVSTLVNTLEQRVTERTTELQAANKELEAFAYSVSHDLRSPLRSINGYSHILLEDFGNTLNEQGRDYLHRVQDNAIQMGKLIDAILQLSRTTRDELNREAVDISNLSRELSTKLNSSVPERDVDWKIEPAMIAHGDSNMLRALLDNLLSNAWKYTSRVEHPCIEIGTTLHHNKPCFFVRDNGAGFDMAYIDKLFKPFQRLHKDEEFEGIGIGLATAQRVIQRHGGWIEAESVPHKGTTFYFSVSTEK